MLALVMFSLCSIDSSLFDLARLVVHSYTLELDAGIYLRNYETMPPPPLSLSPTLQPKTTPLNSAPKR